MSLALRLELQKTVASLEVVYPHVQGEQRPKSRA
jgi:hypothetical protein